MTQDSTLLIRLARVRDLLLRPTAANLDACSTDLEWSVDRIRKLQPAKSAGGAAIAALVRQIRALHEQAGRLRFGAARLANAEAAGYTRAGEIHSGPTSPNMAISG